MWSVSKCGHFCLQKHYLLSLHFSFVFVAIALLVSMRMSAPNNIITAWQWDKVDCRYIYLTVTQLNRAISDFIDTHACEELFSSFTSFWNERWINCNHYCLLFRENKSVNAANQFEMLHANVLNICYVCCAHTRNECLYNNFMNKQMYLLIHRLNYIDFIRHNVIYISWDCFGERREKRICFPFPG